MWDKVAHTLSTPSRTSDSRLGARPRRVLLLCSEALRPHACCVEDALRTRGWATRLEIGKRARRWVRRAPPGPDVLRILLVPEQLDPAVTAKLRAGSDPTNRGALQIVSFETPRGVVAEIERLGGYPATVHRRPSAPRRVLAHPTLCEQALHTDRRWRVGVAAAVAAFSVGWAGTSVAQHATRPTISRAAPTITLPASSVTSMPDDGSSRSQLVDDSVQAAITVPARMDDESGFELDDDAEIYIEDDEIVIDDDDDPDPETPDEEILIFDEPEPAMTVTVAAPTPAAALDPTPTLRAKLDDEPAPRVVAMEARPAASAPLEAVTAPRESAPVTTTPIASAPLDPVPTAKPAVTRTQRVQTIDPFAM
mgnify:CR=1 FL=1